MSDAKGPQKISGHVAVRLEYYILVFGGRIGNFINHTPVSRHMIWMYNLYTEQWSKHMIPESELCPPHALSACAVAIKECVFLFGGYDSEQRIVSNELWKLIKSSEGLFTWCKVNTENSAKPSPRRKHSGWTCSEKLCIFGGLGSSVGGYLNDNRGGAFVKYFNDMHFNNQLLSFNPSCKEWVDLKCSGSVPSPRAAQASTVIGVTVWLYGGYNASGTLDDLYDLNMSSLTWTHAQTGDTNPQRRSSCSLNAITHQQLVLHGGVGSDHKSLSDTWILDLTSQSWNSTNQKIVLMHGTQDQLA